MNIIGVIRLITRAKHSHFISVDIKTYKRWNFFIKILVRFNKNYKPCEIFRKKYKTMENFVVIALKYNGKNVKRRTSGYAKDFVEKNPNTKCIYCETILTKLNCTADHVLPISNFGNNCQVNLITCCRDCNSERGNIDFRKYLHMKNPKYKKQKYIFI